MAGPVYRVRAEWDDQASCWVASSDDVPGLATGADTIEALLTTLAVVVPELLVENGIVAKASLPVEVQIVLQAERTTRIRAAA